MSDLWLAEYARIRQRELDKELEQIYLARKLRAGQHKKIKRENKIMVTLGRMFVNLGEYLQRRYGRPAARQGACGR